VTVEIPQGGFVTLSKQSQLGLGVHLQVDYIRFVQQVEDSFILNSKQFEIL
jgi:hypothetical protein